MRWNLQAPPPPLRPRSPASPSPPPAGRALRAPSPLGLGWAGAAERTLGPGSPPRSRRAGATAAGASAGGERAPGGRRRGRKMAASQELNGAGTPGGGPEPCCAQPRPPACSGTSRPGCDCSLRWGSPANEWAWVGLAVGAGRPQPTLFSLLPPLLVRLSASFVGSAVTARRTESEWLAEPSLYRKEERGLGCGERVPAQPDSIVRSRRASSKDFRNLFLPSNVDFFENLFKNLEFYSDLRMIGCC